jgi:hypothetical protein
VARRAFEHLRASVLVVRPADFALAAELGWSIAGVALIVAVIDGRDIHAPTLSRIASQVVFHGAYDVGECAGLPVQKDSRNSVLDRGGAQG